MRQFIELHQWAQYRGKRYVGHLKPIWVALDTIATLEQGEANFYNHDQDPVETGTELFTWVTFSFRGEEGAYFIRVIETPEQILNQINGY